MFEISCPSCGNPVFFRRESSLYATCDACSSILLRKDVNVELLGKVADLQPDNTPLKVGTTGTYRGKSFEIIGRIQVRQTEGFWNEWYLNYSDGSEGWLGEALGEYFISSQIKEKNLPEFKNISINDCFTFAGTKFYATNIGNSVVSSYEGELPFIMTGSYNLPYVDLRSQGVRAATLDYSDGDPILFIGQYLEFDQFKFQNLRDPDEHIARRSAAQTTTFRCPCCGSPHEMSSAGPQSQSIACEACGSITDISNSEQYKVLWQAKEKKQHKLLIPLGTKAKFKGVTWEVIGYQYKYSQNDGITFPWEEYLCYERCHGYRYLVCSGGHWSWSQTLHELPSNPQTVVTNQHVQGKKFKHFEGYVGHVRHVYGEFPYNVDIQAKSDIQDYISPPFGLSRERDLYTASPEVYWSIAEYLQPEEVYQAFGIKDPLIKPGTVGAFAPNRYWNTMWHTIFTGGLTALLIFMMCLVTSLSSETLLTKSFELRTNAEPSMMTEPFSVTGRTRALEVQVDSDLHNRWIYMDMALVNVDTNEATLFSDSISYYSGNSGGESWSEGSRSTSAIVPRVSPGNYVLRIDPTTGTGNDPEKLEPSKNGTNEVSQKLAQLTVKVNTNPAYWGWGIVVMMGILIFPIIYMFLCYSEESSRWSNSDHPWSSDDDDDDDDD